ncbi:MAG: DPP IV N-terminal domain-containing protein [Planctomycetes bacterium]|nr:DPP IV N-terminal domain-containing protein [Planctomycetota bacterium]
MITPMRATVLILCLGHAIAVPLLRAQESAQSEREAMYYRYLEFASLVKGGSIERHWMADGSSFWYSEGAPANTVIYKVDPKANTKTPLFDTARLRQALTALLGHEPPYKGVPFEEFAFVDGEQAVKFTVEDKDFILQLDTYTTTAAAPRPEATTNLPEPQSLAEPYQMVKEEPSPDGRWLLGYKDHDLWLRSASNSPAQALTTDGIEDYEWGVKGAQWTAQERLRWAWWSPDGAKLAVKRRDYRKVPKVPSISWTGTEVVNIEWVHHSLPGGPITETEIYVIDILSRKFVRVETGDTSGSRFHIIGWRPDGSELLFLRIDREFKKLDLLAANPTSGATRLILTETSDTFVIAWGWEPYITHKVFTMLEDGTAFVWLSERDGWRHLYLYDIDGTLTRRLTKGAFPVLQVLAVDEKAGWVYFMANGDRRRPYDTHLYRVNLQGKELEQLTEGKGKHDIVLAPSKQCFLDTYSSVDRPPVVELRRADGKLLQTLSRANIDALQELQWKPPEEFVATASDGTTDLYGVLYKPYDFDPERKYPVIDIIYAGPQFSEVPHTFIHPHGVDYHAEHGQALAQLGYIVFVVDGRGTPDRGKAFQDVVYGRLGRHEIADHVAVLKQLGAQRPYMDLKRVGVLGWSFGGYFATRALLQAPDVYHVGVAGASNHGNWGSGIDVYMGLSQNNQEGHQYASNLTLVENLRGRLLLIVGTKDTGAFVGEMRFIDALIQAEKRYDLLLLPDQGHHPEGASRTYTLNAARRYFQEHLKP